MRPLAPVLVLGAAAAALQGCGGERPEGPSVVLVIVDTLRADRLGCYGGPEDVSPELDALASESIVFEDVLAPCSWTRPSIAGLVTGLHPRGLGIFKEAGDALPATTRTLAQELGAAGWNTFGITANPNINTCFGFDRGFDTYIDSDVVFEFMDRGDAQETYAFGHVTLPRSRRVLRRALEWAADHGDAPGFLQVDLMEVHERERQLRPEFRERFEGEPDQGYLAAVAQVSHDVGRFVADLRALEGWTDALVVVTSDHGEALDGDHATVVVKPHGDLLYETQLQVPLILSRPGTLDARRIPDRVRLIDVMPTVLELCGLRPSPDLHGVSLAGLLTGTSRPDLPEVFVAETAWREREKLAAYAAEWRYVENRDGHPGTDPVELQAAGGAEDGAATNRLEQHPEIAADLARHLAEWERRHPRVESTEGEALGAPARQQLEAIGYGGD